MDTAAGPLELARHHVDRNRPDRALAVLADVTAGEMESLEFWCLRAQALYELDRYEDAVDAALSGLDLDPEDIELLATLAVAELERGRKKEARAAIDAALELAPDLAELHAQRALILARTAERSFRLASYRKAREAVDEALRLDPYSSAALRVRAQIAALSGDRRAGEYSAELLALDPEDELAHVMNGVVLASRGDVPGGLHHYEEAARLDPSDPKLVWLGRSSRVLRGRFTAPLLFMERLTRGHFRVAWVVLWLASLHAHQLWLSAAVFALCAYLLTVRIYLRMRIGKEPR